MPIPYIEEPLSVDIVIYRGNSFNREIEVENADGTVTDLSGFDAVGVVVDEETGDVKATFTIPALTSDGRIPILLRVQDTSDLDVGSYIWSLTMVGKVNPDVSTTTIMVGNAEVRRYRGGV